MSNVESVTELGSGHSRDAVVFIPLRGRGKDKVEEPPTGTPNTAAGALSLRLALARRFSFNDETCAALVNVLWSGLVAAIVFLELLC